MSFERKEASDQTVVDRFLQILRPHWRQLHALGRRYAATREEAEDAIQETLLRAWRSFSDDPEGSYSRAWLTVILRNVVIDRARSASHRVRLVPMPVSELTELMPAELGDPLAPLPAFDEARFRELLDDRLSSALDAMEPGHKEILLLSAAAGLTYREIAEVLDCPIGTVMSRMGRARRTLRERLAAYAVKIGWVREQRS